MESGVIAKWHKKIGDKVESGDLLLEVSTDKATVEHNALDEGILRKILVEEGKEASVNQPIAVFTETAAESIDSYQPEGVVGEAPKEEMKKVAKPEAPIEKKSSSERIVASPLAKKLAATQGIDLTAIQGSGPRGRIVSKDLESAPLAKKPAFSTSSIDAGTYEEIPLTQMRKVISQRLQEAKSTIPHFYVSQTINVENLISLREQLSHADVKVSINDCIIRACALALSDHPVINSGFNPQKQSVLQYKTIDISVAVSIEGGLITPIVSHADQKTLSQISQEVKGLVQKAKAGKLAPKEFQGGSFTVSNLGMFGITDFQAIINPPQAAILAVGGIQDIPIVKDNQVVPGKVMQLSLSVDHRVIDGVAAAQFIKTLQKYLENPISLLV